ncbi:helix-turn-helix transcriptional regulator [Streptomyces sp.]|uniref:helix-turn-helix transcriptional regulator n=1 Tax=Streptomyces sp. TaxID=1931 RepID=UPI002F954D55
MRADRLVAALLLLQARGRLTAAELAGELDVSVATARRDLEAMAAAGIPVYPQPGRGGGWALVGGARTDLSGLSANEAQALFLLVGPAASVSSEAKAALRKLLGALPRTFRADAEAAANATVVDPTRWGERERPRPEMVGLLQSAVVRRQRVSLGYVDGAGRRTERLVDPWGLVDKDDVWYLVAGTERGRRTFRLDRIAAAEPTQEAADRPDDFALAAAWDEIVSEVEERRSGTWATLVVDARYVRVLRDRFGRHCRVEGEEQSGSGRVRVRVAAPTPLDVARQLAGWGGLVEVREPKAVRDELARLGAELVQRYGVGAGAGTSAGGGVRTSAGGGAGTEEPAAGSAARRGARTETAAGSAAGTAVGTVR